MSNKGLKSGIIAISAAICGYLGAYGGAEGTTKAFRRYGIPAFIAVLCGIFLRVPWVIAVFGFAGVSSIGYGIPSKNDEGSTLGAFWFDCCDFADKHLRPVLATILTQATLGVAYASNMVILALFAKNMGILPALSGVVIAGNALTVVWDKFGQYSLFGKKLLWSETIRFGITGAAYVAISIL